MVVCKNVLLHLEERQRVEVLRVFHKALRSEGVLVMEHTQKLPEALGGFFRPAVNHAQVFVKLPRTLMAHPAETVVPHQRRERVLEDEARPMCSA